MHRICGRELNIEIDVVILRCVIVFPLIPIVVIYLLSVQSKGCRVKERKAATCGTPNAVKRLDNSSCVLLLNSFTKHDAQHGSFMF